MAAESASKSDRPSDNSSDRRITIGENVTDSLVVSGDANQVTYNKIIQISASVVQTRELSQSSPYKGLKGFGLKDKERFFGRDQLIARLLNAVRQHNFVLVSGASGSGKSSVVRAGLIPQLYQRFGSCFQHFIFTPDRDPFDSLYRSLCNPELDQHCSVTDAQIALQAGPDTLMQVVQTLKPKASQWLFFIDQFEELFTIYQDIKKRKTFIEGLIQVANSGESSVTLVLAMRSDFLDQISPYPELGKLAEQTIHFVTDMYLDELRLAIEQPAAQHGVVFEDGLVDKIAEHVEGQAGYLPLLQYTLNLLWETEVETGSIHDRTLNISTYRNLGGVRGALQKHIDQIYGALSKEEKLAAQRIFLKLVEIGGNEESGTEWKSVRRRATRSEFDSEVEQRVLMQLIDENLLVSDRHPQAQEATVEIAHEALLSSWETLNSWITEHRRAIALRNRLNDDVTQWQVEKKEDELWSGAKLLRMQELRKDPTFNQVLGGFSTAANQFIDASLSRRNRQRHRTIIGLAGFSTIALVLAGVASWQWQRSERLRLTTEADQLGILALRGFESGRGEIESLLSAIDAGQKLKALVDSNASPESYPTTSPVLALQTILDNVQERNQFNGHRGQIYGVSFSPDGQRFVTISEDSAVRLWELNGKNTLLEGHKGEVWDIKFASNGQLFATIGEDATVRLWDISGHLVREWQVDKGGCHSLIFTPDGQRLITACSKFGIWDLSGNKIDEWENQNQNAVLSMSISQNGNYLLSSGFGDIVQLRDLSSKKLKLNLKFQQPYIPSVSFTPDNQQFVTATRNGDIQFWDLSGKNIKTFNNQSVISDMKFSPNGQRLAVAGVDGKVRFWSMEGKLLTQFDDPASVDALCFSPDGQHLVMVGERGNIKLLELSKQLMNILNIAGERDGVNLDASLDGKYLATASGGYAQIWDLSRGLLSNWVADGNGWFVSSLSFSQDNRILATASNRFGTVRLWNIESFTQASNHQPSAFAPSPGIPSKLREWNTEQTKYISEMNFSSDSHLAVASNDGMVKLWDIKPTTQSEGSTDPVLLTQLNGHQSAVSTIRFSPDGKLIATGGADGTVRLWTIKGQQLNEVRHQDPVSTVRFSPDGKLIATGWTDGTIRILNIQGQKLAQSEGHQGAISSFGFSSNGQILASGGIDGTVRVWNLSGQELTHFYTHQGKIPQVNFMLDGRIITSGSDGTVRVWKLGERGNLEQLLSRGCSWLKDYFATHPEVLDKVSTCRDRAS